MAVFHYSLELLPLCDSEAYTRILDDRKVESTQSAIWTQQPTTETLDRLRSLMPLDQSWGPCEEFVSSKQTWNSDLRIWHSDDSRSYVEEIMFRFSSVEMPLHLLEAFLEIADDGNYVVGSVESKCVFAPTLYYALADFKSSRAARFRENPFSTTVEAARQIDADDRR